MAMISFAQNAEDVLLSRLFPSDYIGFYFDVGANHPTLHSVTRHFYDRGWNGVNVEPVERVHAMLCAERPRDVNLNLAVSSREGELTLHEPPSSLGMATVSLPFAAGLRAHGYEYVERKIRTRTLASLCEEHARERTIDFMKIDVEGHEEDVIAGGDWSTWRPRVLVVEATIDPDSWEPMLLKADYLYAAFDGLNRYYVRREDESFVELMRAPANVLDDYLPFEVWRRLHDLETELGEARSRVAELEVQVQSQAMALARRLQSVAGRYPAMARVARRWLKPAG